VTEWCVEDNCGWESAFDSWYEGEMKNLYLQFEVSGASSDLANQDWAADYTLDAEERCLVCMNVDENSELRDGDTGFAVCYNTAEGNMLQRNHILPRQKIPSSPF